MKTFVCVTLLCGIFAVIRTDMPDVDLREDSTVIGYGQIPSYYLDINEEVCLMPHIYSIHIYGMPVYVYQPHTGFLFNENNPSQIPHTIVGNLKT